MFLILLLVFDGVLLCSIVNKIIEQRPTWYLCLIGLSLLVAGATTVTLFVDEDNVPGCVLAHAFAVLGVITGDDGR